MFSDDRGAVLQRLGEYSGLLSSRGGGGGIDALNNGRRWRGDKIGGRWESSRNGNLSDAHEGSHRDFGNSLGVAKGVVVALERFGLDVCRGGGQASVAASVTDFLTGPLPRIDSLEFRLAKPPQLVQVVFILWKSLGSVLGLGQRVEEHLSLFAVLEDHSIQNIFGIIEESCRIRLRSGWSERFPHEGPLEEVAHTNRFLLLVVFHGHQVIGFGICTALSTNRQRLRAGNANSVTALGELL